MVSSIDMRKDLYTDYSSMVDEYRCPDCSGDVPIIGHGEPPRYCQRCGSKLLWTS